MEGWGVGMACLVTRGSDAPQWTPEKANAKKAAVEKAAAEKKATELS